MGAIWFRGAEFVASLSETVGFKTGLALSEGRLHGILDEIDPDLWPASDDVVIRIRAEEFEDVFAGILHRLGAGPAKPIVTPMGQVHRRHANDPARLAVVQALGPRLIEFLEDALKREQPSSGIDPTDFLRAAAESHGSIGREIAQEFLETTNAYLYQSPFNQIRQVEWNDIRDLDDLFRSEHFESKHGEFFDQRFVDFLDANFDDIDRINWRQFEGLAAEYFDRSGFAVALGPGRNDDGVDIRLWPREPDATAGPAVTLVQCKRERRKIGKAVVKALWADVVHARAESGLIVTTSSFSPGARTTRSARGYPIAEADRESLRKWIRSMRTPGSGVFLGE